MKKITVGCLFALGVAACSSDTGVLSYEEFRDQAYFDGETGTYVVNGDELVETEADMRAMYQNYVASAKAAEGGLSTVEQGLIVNRVSSRDDKWAAATASNLTYCISRTSFGSRYNTVVSAMNSATAAWEATARVNFVHQSSSDSACSTSTGVVFNVRLVNTGGQYLARISMYNE